MALCHEWVREGYIAMFTTNPFVSSLSYNTLVVLWTNTCIATERQRRPKEFIMLGDHLNRGEGIQVFIHKLLYAWDSSSHFRWLGRGGISAEEKLSLFRTNNHRRLHCFFCRITFEISYFFMLQCPPQFPCSFKNQLSLSLSLLFTAVFIKTNRNWFPLNM